MRQVREADKRDRSERLVRDEYYRGWSEKWISGIAQKYVLEVWVRVVGPQESVRDAGQREMCQKNGSVEQLRLQKNLSEE